MVRLADIRIKYIDWRLLNAGTLRRADIVDTFGISVASAAADIAEFMRRHPKAMRYDKSAKCYVPAKSPYRPVRGAKLGPMVETIVELTDG